MPLGPRDPEALVPWRQVLLLEAGTNDPNRTQEETKNNHINYRGARRHKSLDCSPRRNENACCMEYALAVSSSDKTGREMRVANGGAPILHWSCFVWLCFQGILEELGAALKILLHPGHASRNCIFRVLRRDFQSYGKRISRAREFQNHGRDFRRAL